MDEELSTIDNLLLNNAETEEVNESNRGATDNPIGRTKSFPHDWKINGHISGEQSNTKRVQQGQKQLEKVMAKYGKE